MYIVLLNVDGAGSQHLNSRADIYRHATISLGIPNLTWPKLDLGLGLVLLT